MGIINSTSEMALITGEQYVQAWGAVFGVYALLMLLVPEKMVSDHFKAKCTPMNAFWIRGQSVSVAVTAYLLQKIPTAEAVDFGLLITAAIAILYPYNAKFGLISKNMPVKYTGFPPLRPRGADDRVPRRGPLPQVRLNRPITTRSVVRLRGNASRAQTRALADRPTPDNRERLLC